MIKLKTILTELSEKNTLYHRSLKKMKVGDIIKPHMGKSGAHWLSNKAFEAVLEAFRKKNYPDRPSRLNCIYSSLIPKSRFIDKGYLYVVQPTGKMFMTDSLLIDEMDDKFSRETMNFYERGIKNDDIVKNPEKFLHELDYFSAERYWKGKIHGIRKNVNRIEVLSESAQVIEVVSEDKLNVGDKVKITEPNKVDVEITLYVNENDISKYKEKTDDTFNKFIEDVNRLFSGNVEPKLTIYDFGNKDGNIRFKGFLNAGVKLKIVWLESILARPDEYGDDYEDSRRKEGKYKQMKFQFYLNNKLYSSRENNKKNNLPNYTMQYFNHWSRDNKNKVFDISRHMAKTR